MGGSKVAVCDLAATKSSKRLACEISRCEIHVPGATAGGPGSLKKHQPGMSERRGYLGGSNLKTGLFAAPNESLE